MQRALRVAITGKIASGKSTVSQEFRKLGITVLDTDAIAKQLMEVGPDIRTGVISIFGEQAYDGEKLNRSYLAEQIFSDKAKRTAVEEIVHPAVSEYAVVQFLEAKHGTIVAVESALVFQTTLWALMDYIVLVDAKDEAVITRGSASGRFTSEQVATRLNEQAYNDSFRSRADFVIENSGTVEALQTKAGMLATVLLALAKRDLPEEPLQQREEPSDVVEG